MAKLRIDTINEYGDISFNYETIVSDIKKVIYDHFKTQKNATIILVNEEKIKEINTNYRHIEKVTDVISFEEFEDDYLGEIFVCIDKVYLQAKEFNHSNEREFAFLITHGLLHLHGYDHQTQEDEKVMFSLQDELLDKTIYKRN